jgi:hypothetical protein
MRLFSARLPGIAFCIVSLFCLSCTGNAGGERSPATENSVSATDGAAAESVPALSVADALRLPEGNSGRRMILESGNFWTTGIPGFGENALPALSGMYRIAPAASPDEMFTVWVCRETLYYDDWDIRAGASFEDFRVMEKYGRDGLLVAVPFNEIWTGVFGFPGDSNFSQNDIDRIIGIYRSRFLYFFAMTYNGIDISLPAQADF